MRVLVLVLALLAFSASAQVGVLVTAPPYNAVGDGVTDDTAAFQAAANAGQGIVWVPATANCYMVSGLNLTMKADIAFEGAGDRSKLCVSGANAANWIDLAGSERISFRNLKIVSSGSIVPKTLFFWASTTAPVGSLSFDGVSIDAKTTVAHLYAYGYDGLRINAANWIQRYDGAYSADPSQRTSVIRLDAENSGNLSSSNVSISTGQQVAWNTTISNGSRFIDFPPGYGSGSRDNNATFICVTCGGTLHMQGGVIHGLGRDLLVLWWFPEGVTFDGVSFAASDGSVTALHFVQIGGGIAGNINLLRPFFSVPALNGAFVAIGAPYPGRSGGVGNFRLLNPEIGGNTYGVHLITVDFSCSAPAVNPWFQNAQIEGWASTIVACGNLDPSVNLRGITYVYLPAGAANNASASWGPP